MSINTTKGPFDVSVTDLNTLSPASAVDIFHDLLIAEAIFIAIPITAVSVPKAITTADGGVDAEVAAIPDSIFSAGLIKNGLVRYQIKTGSFSASGISDIRSLIIQPKYHTEKNFKPEHMSERVRSCLDQNGRLVIVLFGSDAVGKKDDHGVKEIIEFLTKIDSKYKNAKVEILRANQICAAIKLLSPALALRLNNIAAPLRTLDYLENSCGLETTRYESTEDLLKQAKAITDQSEALDGFKHIRVLGDAGAGKTHLVFNALALSAVKTHVLYCEYAEELDASNAFQHLIHLCKTAIVVLVADECDLETANLLQTRLKRIAPHFLLITIYNQFENDDSLENIQLLEVPSLSDEAMTRIFASYGIPEDRQIWLSELCRGSPRAAHRIGQFISSNPEKDYAAHFSKLDSFWETLVCSPDDKSSVNGLARLTVMRTVALFRKLIWKSTDGDQGKEQLLILIKLIDPNMTPALLASTIQFLQGKRVLQGKSVLYISPKLLHIKLWCDWWDRFGDRFNLTMIRSSLSGRMLTGFFDMFTYAKESKAASDVVEKLLSQDGPFSNLEDFSRIGNGQLFFALAQANPKAALRVLKNALKAANKAQRNDFKSGRREVVHGLERLAVPASDFEAAAECLVLLAEEENETWSNNSTGVFISLFSLGYGKLAASELSPLAKIPYLRGLLKSDNVSQRQIAVRALSESLRPFISRADIGDTVGLRWLPNRWVPDTYADLWDAYDGHVKLLAEAFRTLPTQKERLDAAIAIIESSRNLLSINPISENIIALMNEFSDENELRSQVIESLIATLHYDGKSLPSNVVEALEKLRITLTETSFHDRLHRYAGLQLLEDNFTNDGVYTDLPPKGVLRLCSEVLEKNDLLLSELDWLLSGEAKNAFQFGVLLGEGDKDNKLLPQIETRWLSKPSPRDNLFFGGFLAGVFKRDISHWENIASNLLSKTEIVNDVFSLIWRSGMSDLIASQLLELSLSGSIQANRFRIFVYGGILRQFPLSVLRQLLNQLIKTARQDNSDADAALDIIQSRLRTNPEDSKELIGLLEAILNSSEFIDGVGTYQSNNTMRDYHWNLGAKMLLKLCPEQAFILACKAIQTFGNKGSITDGYRPQTTEFLNEVLKKQPEKLWFYVAPRFEKTNKLPYELLQWLRGDSRNGTHDEQTGFGGIPPEVILKWIDVNIEERAVLIAQYCQPKINEQGESPVMLARLILEKYGSRKDVRNALHANFFTCVFSGPASAYYQNNLEYAVKLKGKESNEFVKLWLQEEIESLATMVQHEIDKEEQDF